LLYQDTQTEDLYYGAPDEPDRVKILSPRKEKRKAREKRRTGEERKSLMSRLVVWRHQERANSSIPAAVRPSTFIIDDASITTLSKLHANNITDYRQIRILLDQTAEWEESWSKKIFAVIQQFNEDLITLRQTATTKKKNQQKRAKIDQDRISFEQESKENEERIRLQVLKQFEQQLSLSRSTLQNSNANNVCNSNPKV
jgi:hypothetical protein